MNNRAGTYRLNPSTDAPYKSFVPNPLPPEITLDSELLALLIDANKKLATLEAIASRIPDKGIFTAAYVVKEALISSQIEGTQATLEDILDPLIDANANRDVEEVINYVRAVEHAIALLEELPLCNRLICETHRVLMQGVRGHDKTPGEFRRTQNWIGGHGVALNDAKYIPPNPQDMLQAMVALERYINSDDATDDLIRAALIHYQFETIHPFLDGNGRIGRLLITLFLLDRKILSTPTLYISFFLKKYRTEYYARLSDVRLKGDFEQWIKFFLRAVIDSAVDAIQTTDKISALQRKNLAAIQSLGRKKPTAARVFEYLAAHPILDIKQTATALNLARSTTSVAFKTLTDLEILAQVTNTSRKKVFIYKEYLAILRTGT